MEAPMRRFTPPAASPAIDNCRLASLPNPGLRARKNRQTGKSRQLT